MSSNRCPICLGDIQSSTGTDTCRHSFCYSCVKEWSKSSLECPLCKTKYSKLLRIQENIFEDLPPPTKKTVDDTVVDLECVTDKELVAESSRLLESALRAERELFLSSSQKDRRVYEYKHLKKVIFGLENMKTHLLSNDRYEPKATIEQLYKWEHILTLLWMGKIDDLVSLLSAEDKASTPEKVRFGADDDYQEEEGGDELDEGDYDDDYDDDDEEDYRV